MTRIQIQMFQEKLNLAVCLVQQSACHIIREKPRMNRESISICSQVYSRGSELHEKLAAHARLALDRSPLALRNNISVIVGATHCCCRRAAGKVMA